jgi:hypothetical protein
MPILNPFAKTNMVFPVEGCNIVMRDLDKTFLSDQIVEMVLGDVEHLDPTWIFASPSSPLLRS